MQVCTSHQTHNHAIIPPLSFLQAGCPSSCPTKGIKALKRMCILYIKSDIWKVSELVVNAVKISVSRLADHCESYVVKVTTM